MNALNLTKSLLCITLAAGLTGCEAVDPRTVAEDEHGVHLDIAADVDEHSESESALIAPNPVRFASGSWWGNTQTPLVNQLWGEIINGNPGKNISDPYTYRWKCHLPKFDGFRQTLTLRRAILQVDDQNVKVFDNPAPGAEVSYTLNPDNFASGWHEIRIRCVARETVDTDRELGEETAITAGIPVQFNSGTGSSGAHHGMKNYLDTHGWYSRGVGYVYARVVNIGDVVGQTLKGTVNLDVRSAQLGDTQLHHFRVTVAKLSGDWTSGQLSSPVILGEFTTHGNRSTSDFSYENRVIALDTTKFADGTYVLAMHSHGLEESGSEAPGKQVASEFRVLIRIDN
jgi:hypothetical protein